MPGLATTSVKGDPRMCRTDVHPPQASVILLGSALVGVKGNERVDLRTEVTSVGSLDL